MQIYPPSSVAYAPASPQGEAFLTLCEHSERGVHGRYVKYIFELWFAFTIRPRCLVMQCERNLAKRLPLGVEAVA